MTKILQAAVLALSSFTGAAVGISYMSDRVACRKPPVDRVSTSSEAVAYCRMFPNRDEVLVGDDDTPTGCVWLVGIADGIRDAIEKGVNAGVAGPVKKGTEEGLRGLANP